MVSDTNRLSLKRALLKDISYLCHHSKARRLWNEEIVQTIRDLKAIGSPAVFFGGTLRSMMVSRFFHRRPGRPRDLDIVVSGITVDELRNRFQRIITRETRFGGFRMERTEWEFDVWPLDRTWSFVQENVANPSFAALPMTTFLNLEAIAVDVWPTKGQKRRIYSGDDQFFDGILRRTLEINREENPFPTLCVVRSLLMAARLDFSIGNGLAHYIALHGSGISGEELEEVQRKHYGIVRHSGRTLQFWIKYVADCSTRDREIPLRLPIQRQLTFWPQDEDALAVRMRVLT